MGVLRKYLILLLLNFLLVSVGCIRIKQKTNVPEYKVFVDEYIQSYLIDSIGNNDLTVLLLNSKQNVLNILISEKLANTAIDETLVAYTIINKERYIYYYDYRYPILKKEDFYLLRDSSSLQIWTNNLMKVHLELVKVNHGFKSRVLDLNSAYKFFSNPIIHRLDSSECIPVKWGDDFN